MRLWILNRYHCVTLNYHSLDWNRPVSVSCILLVPLPCLIISRQKVDYTQKRYQNQSCLFCTYAMRLLATIVCYHFVKSLKFTKYNSFAQLFPSIAWIYFQSWLRGVAYQSNCIILSYSFRCCVNQNNGKANFPFHGSFDTFM